MPLKNKVGRQNENNFQNAVHFIFHWKLKNDALFLSANFKTIFVKSLKGFAVKFFKWMNFKISFFHQRGNYIERVI